MRATRECDFEFLPPSVISLSRSTIPIDPYSRIFGVALRSILGKFATTGGRRPLTSERSSHYPVKYPFLLARTGMTRKIDRCPFLFALPSVWSVRQHPTERISRRRLLRNPFRGDRKMIEIAVRWNLVDLRDLQSWRTASNFTISLIYEPLDTLFIILAHLGEERFPAREYCRP